MCWGKVESGDLVNTAVPLSFPLLWLPKELHMADKKDLFWKFNY